MLTRIRNLLAAPVFEDEEKTRTAKLLNVILLILAALTTVLLSILSFPSSAFTSFNLLIGGVMIAVVVGMQWLMRRGHVRTASVLLSCALLAMTTSTIYVFGGIRDTAATAYFLVIAVAALLLGGRAAVIFGLLSILAALGVFYAEIRGAIILPLPASVRRRHDAQTGRQLRRPHLPAVHRPRALRGHPGVGQAKDPVRRDIHDGVQALLAEPADVARLLTEAVDLDVQRVALKAVAERPNPLLCDAVLAVARGAAVGPLIRPVIRALATLEAQRGPVLDRVVGAVHGQCSLGVGDGLRSRCCSSASRLRSHLRR